MMVVGRAIRYMPSIQNVKVVLGDCVLMIGHEPLDWDISFNLKLERSVPDCIPQANLSISLPDPVGDIPSEAAKVLWKDSLLHVVTSSLDFRVEYKFPPLIII